MSTGPLPGAILFLAGETLRDACSRLASVFARVGIETPEADARYLLRGVLGLDANELVRAPERALGERAQALTEAAVRRLKREPVSRILGEREFFGRAFEVTHEVLDPRPDTETIVEAVLELADRKGGRQAPLRIADIGLGSGAILVTLLAELPRATGVGTDIAAGALSCARRNAALHGVAGRLEAVETSILKGVGGPFDIVVSNPPYIPTADIGALEAEVREYDPLTALDGGADGLAVYREICSEIMGLQRLPDVVLEVGAGQAEAVAAIFAAAEPKQGSWRAAFRRDLGGHVRCVTLAHQC